MKKRKILAVIMSAIMLLSVLPFSLINAAAETGSELGDEIEYSFDSETGALEISGCGLMNVFYEGESPFCGNDEIKSVVISGDIINVGSYLFEDCTNLESVEYSEAVLFFGDYVFLNCRSLRSFELTESTDLFGVGVFCGCESLESFTYTDKFPEIGEDMFRGCTSLAEVTIPIEIEEIKASAFDSCESLTDVYYGGTKAQWKKLPIASGNRPLKDATVHYTDIEPVGLVSLELVSMPDKTVYYDDEEFDTAGLVVNAVYRNTIIEIENYELSYDFSQVGDTVVTLSYTDGGVTETLEIPVRVELPNTTFSLNVIEETDDYVVLSVRLARGEFYSVDLCIKPISGKIGECAYTCESDEFDMFIKAAKKTGGAVMTVNYMEPGKYGIATTTAYSIHGEDIVICQYAKNYTEHVSNQDLTLEIISCTNADEPVEYVVVNNLPDASIVHEHEYRLVETVNETCCEDGYNKYACFCGDSYKVAIPAHDHSPVHMVSQVACGMTGIEFDFCTECGGIFNRIQTPAAGHIFGGWTAIYPVDNSDAGAERFCTKCGENETAVLPKTLINCYADGALVSGFRGGLSVDEFMAENVENNGNTVSVSSPCGRIGTGTAVTVKYQNGVELVYSAVLYGDVNGDGWYDGTDAIIVYCIAEGMLTQADLSAAEYAAADCSRDGVIDSADVEILTQAGLLLAEIDQSVPTEELLENSSVYSEYLSLIEQDTKTEEPSANFFFDFLVRIFNYIRLLLSIIRPNVF